jgi:hypothetical protein
MRVVEVIPPSSHLRFTASQGKLDWNLAESQNLARESGENSRRKLQNVVTDSTAIHGCHASSVGNWDNAVVPVAARAAKRRFDYASSIP